MLASFPIAPAAVSLIDLYQRYLSPHKGFSCAYRVRRRRESCSQFGKRVIARFGVAFGSLLLRRRFHHCAAAARVLDYEPKVERKRRQDRRDSKSSCDAADCGNPLDGCDGFGCGDLAGCLEFIPCDV